MIEGMSVEEFIRENADPIWLHQNEMWEYIETEPKESLQLDENEEIPFLGAYSEIRRRVARPTHIG